MRVEIDAQKANYINIYIQRLHIIKYLTKTVWQKCMELLQLRPIFKT